MSWTRTSISLFSIGAVALSGACSDGEGTAQALDATSGSQGDGDITSGDGDASLNPSGDGDATLDPSADDNTGGTGDGDAGTGGDTGTGGDGDTGTGGDGDTGTGGDPATPDDVNCTEDLETCYEEMASNGGGTIVLDAKTYLISNTITIESNVTVTGQGPGQTLIAWETPSNRPMFNRTSGSADNTRWTDLTIDCGGNFNDNPGWTNARGIYLTGGGSQADASSLAHNDFSMDNVEVLNCGGEGIQIKGTGRITLNEVNFHHNGYGENNTSLWHNMYLKRAREIVITNSQFTESPVGHGMRMSDLEDVSLEDVVITGNGEHGIHANNCVDFVGTNVTVNNNCNMPEGACHESICYGDCSNFNPL